MWTMMSMIDGARPKYTLSESRQYLNMILGKAPKEQQRYIYQVQWTLVDLSDLWSD